MKKTEIYSVFQIVEKKVPVWTPSFYSPTTSLSNRSMS